MQRRTERQSLHDSAKEPQAGNPGAPGSFLPTVDECIRIGGETLSGLIFFGSQLIQSSPDAHSIADFFVIVSDYKAFYKRLRSLGQLRRPVWLVTLLNHTLPPNVLSVASTADSPGAKGFILSETDFTHTVSPGARDHFCRGRLSQQVRIVYARDARTRERLKENIAAARRHSLQWVPLYVNAPFSVQNYCLRMLQVSFANEFRPESNERVLELFNKQADFFEQTYGDILASAASTGELERQKDLYCERTQASAMRRLRWRWYFWRSGLRATMRWAKYVFTFEEWLDYIVHKIERRTGMHVELSRAERRFPLLILWPKALRVLLALRSVRKQKRPEQKVSPNAKG